MPPLVDGIGRIKEGKGLVQGQLRTKGTGLTIFRVFLTTFSFLLAVTTNLIGNINITNNALHTRLIIG